MAKWQGRIEERLRGTEKLWLQGRRADREAVDKAFAASEKLAEKHNDLIKQMQERDKNYVAQDVYDERHKALQDKVSATQNLQAKIVGGMGVLAVIGISNLIRVWSG